MLEHSQLSGLLARRNGSLWICNIPERARRMFRCSSGAVYLSRESAMHILDQHEDIDTYQLLLLPVAIENGRLLRQLGHERFINSLYVDGNDKAFFVAMKVAAGGHELWVSSMYRLSARQILRKLKRSVDV